MNFRKMDNFLVNKNFSIKKAMRVIDKNSMGIVFVVDGKKKLFGVVTDGDIRRAILKGINIEKPIEEIANKNPITIRNEFRGKDFLNLKKQKEKMPPGGSLKVPVVDRTGRIKDIMVFAHGDNSKDYPVASPKPRLSREGIKKVLIIGGAGYLGSVLCRKLLNERYKVRVLDNLTYGDEGIKELYKKRNFEFLKGDIRNISEVLDGLKGMDAAIHLAAIVGDPACALDPRRTLEINYLATKAIAEACKFNQVNKFLFASTCSVYGASKNPQEHLHENSCLNPVSLYAETKLKSEGGIAEAQDENFSPTIFRFATLYGISPRLRFDLVVNLLTVKAHIDKKITIFGGEQWRPNIDVSDAAEACLKWVQSPIEKVGGQIFNVGVNEQNYQILQIGHVIKKIFPEVKMEVKEKDGDERNYNVAFDKITQVLKFKPEKTIERGVYEIKNILQNKNIKDISNPKYDNYRFLTNSS